MEKIITKKEFLNMPGLDKLENKEEIFKTDGLIKAYKKDGRWVALQKNYEKWLMWSLFAKQWTVPQLMQAFGWSYKQACNNIRELGGTKSKTVWEGYDTNCHWYIDKDIWYKNWNEYKLHPDRFSNVKI